VTIALTITRISILSKALLVSGVQLENPLMKIYIAENLKKLILIATSITEELASNVLQTRQEYTYLTSQSTYLRENERTYLTINNLLDGEICRIDIH